MSGEDFEVTQEIHTVLGRYMKDREADACLVKLSCVMRNEEDGAELVRLMQKWMAYI